MLNSKSNWFQSTWSWYTVCGCQTYSSTTLRHSRFLQDLDIDANISWGTFWIRYIDILMLIYQQSLKCFENALSYFCFISNNHHRWSMFFQSSRDSGSIRQSASITGQLSNRLIICSHVLKERSTFTSKVLPMSRSCRNICSQATQSFSWY